MIDLHSASVDQWRTLKGRTPENIEMIVEFHFKLDVTCVWICELNV